MPLKVIFEPFFLIFSRFQLLREFVLRDIKGRFAGSFAGLLWTVLNPLATIVAYFFVFSLVMRISVTVEETGTDRFVIFFLCGFFPWVMFAESLNKSVGSLIAQSSLITKVLFPVELIPLSTLISAFITNAMGFGLFLIYIALDGYLHISWLWVPVLLLIEMLFALGLCLFLSAICVFIRDTAELLSVVTMLWFFATPIIYPFSMVPESMKFFFKMNPVALMVENFRDVLLLHTPDPWMISITMVVAMMSFACGSWFFSRSKVAFGDVL
ncbi:MAG: ABC transporter permease [Desulfamplus sp.]|nr:ABC transporter permease [Desulfamplus sp.]